MELKSSGHLVLLYAVELKLFAGQLECFVCCGAEVVSWTAGIAVCCMLYAAGLRSSSGQLVLLYAVELKSSAGQLVLMSAVELQLSGQLV